VLVKNPPVAPQTSEELQLNARSLEKAARKKPGAKGRVFAGFQALVYLALSMAGLEALFACAHVGEGEFLMPDKRLGYTLMPSKQITWRKEGFGQFKTNSFGMQDEEIPLAKPPGTLRVAIFGDSYVESLHVARDKNFLNVAQKKLTELLHKPVQILNFGVSNYSVAQCYLRYQTVAKQFHPDVVVQVFRVEESDKLLPQRSDLLAQVRPVFFVGPHNELVYDDTNVKAFMAGKTGKRMVGTDWLRRNSRLYIIGAQAWQALSTFGKKAAPKADALDSPNATNAAIANSDAANKERYLRCYWYMMDGQLAAFKQECAKAGTKFIIMRDPMIKAGMDGLRTNRAEDELLYKTASKIGAPVLDLDTAYKNQFGLKNDGTHFLPMGHYNAGTHAWVGQHLADYLSTINIKGAP
jgi:hypothetical protein